MVGHVTGAGSRCIGNMPGLQASLGVDDKGVCCTSAVPVQGLAAIAYAPAAQPSLLRVVSLHQTTEVGCEDICAAC